LNVLDLFSGIGGFALGLESCGMHTVAFCERDAYAATKLRRRWPDVPIYDDVQTLTADRLAADGIAAPDIICGGFPCQDISVAGKGAGLGGARSGLWGEVARLVREVRPRYMLVENSPALAWRGLGRILSDLSALGYAAEWHCIRAAAIGCPFEGDRIYILATPNLQHGQEGVGLRQPIVSARAIQRAHHECRASVWLEAACRSARMGDGFSDRVDRRRRTEVLGNAVVPQVVAMIGRAILAAEAART
jgi:DNA (cytosine-5)-methyltransferase 1